MVQTLHEAFTKARSDLLLALFNKIIRPVADRHDWEIAWAMGSVFFMNKNLEDVSETKAVSKLEDRVRKITDDVYPRSQCSGLWDVLGSMHPAGSYHKSHGQFKDFDERIRRKRRT